MRGFTIACILEKNASSSTTSSLSSLTATTSHFKRKISDLNEDNEYQLTKRQTIEGK